MLNSILVASLEATSGSVMANAERILPSSNGSNHCFFWASLPYLANTSMLPVSGAAQLNTSDAHITLPIISASGAYSKLVNPALYLP